jgi:restriction system protein
MTFLDAAARVLESLPVGESLHYREITRRALDQSLIETQGLTPETSMSAQLTNDIKRRSHQGEPSRFEKTGRGLYALASKTDPDISQLVKEHNDRIRERLRARLLKMDPYAFEQVIGNLLEYLGFQEIYVTSRSNDGGIDVIGWLVVADVIRTRMAVQVKRWSSNIQRPIVQQVRGSLGVHDQGLIITTGGFSSGAIEEATKENAVRVALMDGNTLITQLITFGIGVRESVTLLDLIDESAETLVE